MKVVGISGSSHMNGNTTIIIKTVFEELNNAGIATELIQLADIDIQPCRACFACKGKKTAQAAFSVHMLKSGRREC